KSETTRNQIWLLLGDFKRQRPHPIRKALFQPNDSHIFRLVRVWILCSNHNIRNLVFKNLTSFEIAYSKYQILLGFDKLAIVIEKMSSRGHKICILHDEISSPRI